MPMNIKQARMVDPVLSQHLRGYTNADYVAKVLFPEVPVTQRGGKRIEFGKDAFRLQNTRRAPGAQTERYQLGYEGRNFALHQERLIAQVPEEISDEAAKGPGIDLEKAAVEMTYDKILLGLEVEAARLARDPASYASGLTLALSGQDRFSDPNSDPETVIDDAMETVRKRIGRNPNLMLVGPAAFRALKRHPKVKEQFKYTSGKSITADMLAEFFGVARVVKAEAVFLDATAPDDAPANDIWGNDIILAYVPKRVRSSMEPSFAYTYQLRGTPMAEKGAWNHDRRSWEIPVVSEHAPLIVGPDAGFLIQTAA